MKLKMEIRNTYIIARAFVRWWICTATRIVLWNEKKNHQFIVESTMKILFCLLFCTTNVRRCDDFARIGHWRSFDRSENDCRLWTNCHIDYYCISNCCIVRLKMNCHHDFLVVGNCHCDDDSHREEKTIFRHAFSLFVESRKIYKIEPSELKPAIFIFNGDLQRKFFAE